MTVQARKDEVLRYLGYAGQVMTDDLEQRLDQAIAVCAQDVQPAGYFQVHPLRAITDETGAPAQAVEGTPLCCAAWTLRNTCKVPRTARSWCARWA